MTLRWAYHGYDATDPDRLARFWEEALGWRRVHDQPDEVMVAAPEDGPDAGHPKLVFIRVPDGKSSAKNRLHLDLRPDDTDAEVARLTELGATRVSIGQPPDANWTVMADPEGNEFCVLWPKRATAQ